MFEFCLYIVSMGSYMLPHPLYSMSSWYKSHKQQHVALLYMHNIILGKPLILDISSNRVSLEGSKVNLSCNATNDPDAVHPLHVYWYNSDGNQVTSDGEHVLVYNHTDSSSGQVQSVILFDHVNRSDDGTYTCRAFNDPNSTTDMNTTLTVECTLVK